MYFRNKDIPNNFNKIAEVGDNHIVWVKEQNLSSNNSYEAYIQFFKPCYYLIHLNNYTINKGTNYTITPNYSNNGMYSYIVDYDMEYTLTTTEQISGDDYNTNIKYIADYNELTVTGFCIIICILWVLNNISKLWTKGGCFL